MFDLAAYTAAKLRPTDLARLLHVSRVACSLWFNGHSRPHRLLEKRIAKVDAVVNAALAAGDLPLPAGVARGEREPRLRKIFERHLFRLKLGSLDD